jgi:hypothetical protein
MVVTGRHRVLVSCRRSALGSGESMIERIHVGAEKSNLCGLALHEIL